MTTRRLPKCISKRFPFARTLLALAAAAALAPLACDSDQEAVRADPPVDRASYGSPPLGGGPTLDLDGQPYFGAVIRFDTTRTPTVEEVRDIESRGNGTVCGASPFSDVFYLCLNAAASSTEQLLGRAIAD